MNILRRKGRYFSDQHFNEKTNLQIREKLQKAAIGIAALCLIHLKSDFQDKPSTTLASFYPPASPDFSTDMPLPFSPYIVELPVDNNSSTSSLTI